MINKSYLLDETQNLAPEEPSVLQPSPQMANLWATLEKSKPTKGKQAKAEMQTQQSSKKSVKRDLYADADTLASRLEGVEALPMFEEQRRGIKQAEDMLAMTQGQQESPNYDHIVQPFLSLTDAWTGSRMSSNFKPSDTDKKARNVATMQDDIQKRRGDYNKQLLDALKASKEGTESTEQTQQLKEMLARMEGFNMGKGDGAGGMPKSPYQEKLDSEFGKEAASYIAGGGYTRVQKNLNELDGIVKKLQSGDKNISGPAIGMVPKGIRSSVPGLRDSAYIQERVAGVIMQSLKEILGAQFTQQEGIELVKTAYNPNASEAENAERLQAAVDELRTKAEAKLESAKYADQYGTLKGYGGTARVSGSNKPPGQAPQGAPPAAAPGGQSDKVTVMNPQGQKGSIPRAQLASALAQGYKEVK